MMSSTVALSVNFFKSSAVVKSPWGLKSTRKMRRLSPRGRTPGWLQSNSSHTNPSC